MVLGFGSKRKKPSTEPVFIRVSPSLPELAQQRIPWPEDLVDINAVHALGDEPPASEEHGKPPGASKTSFQGTRGPVPFHKPFRAGDSAPGTPSDSQHNNVAGLFGSGVPPPSSFNGVGSRARAGSYPKSTRRTKHAPTFNVMVNLRLFLHCLLCLTSVTLRLRVPSKPESHPFSAFSLIHLPFLQPTRKNSWHLYPHIALRLLDPQLPSIPLVWTFSRARQRTDLVRKIALL